MGRVLFRGRPLETPFSWKVVVAAIAIGLRHGRCWRCSVAVNVDRSGKHAVVDQYRESRRNFSYRYAPRSALATTSPPLNHGDGGVSRRARQSARPAPRYRGGAARRAPDVDHAIRHRPDVPEHPSVPGHDRDRERHGRHVHRRENVRPSGEGGRVARVRRPGGQAQRTGPEPRPMATSGGSRSPARWPPTRSSCCSTNRPPG